MTENNDVVIGEIVARLQAGLDPMAYDTLDDPIGWQCRLCGGRFVVSGGAQPSADPLDRAVTNLLDAAAYHHRADHCDTP